MAVRRLYEPLCIAFGTTVSSPTVPTYQLYDLPHKFTPRLYMESCNQKASKHKVVRFISKPETCQVHDIIAEFDPPANDARAQRAYTAGQRRSKLRQEQAAGARPRRAAVGTSTGPAH